MSAVPTNKKRERQVASQVPARHSGEGRNLVSPQLDSSSHDGSEWKELRLDEAVEIIRGITFPSGAKAKVPSSDSIACLRTTNVQREVEWDDLWYVAKSFVKRESQFVRENDILISNANSYELVGKVAFIGNIPTPATLGTFITLFRTRSGNDSKFIYFQLSSSEVQAAIRSMASTTTNISNISTAKLAQIVLRFPSLSKQRQIVAEIEKQFTRLDAGVAALRRVQSNLKRYRATVLKAACEGHLVPTEAELAKAEGRTYETGEQLLARILADRRKNWHGRGKYKEPAALEIMNLPPLPKGWAWARLEQLGVTYGGLTKNPKRARLSNQLPYLRVANVYANELRLDDIEYIGVADSELEKLLVRAGDLLIVEGNGSKDQIGRLAIWDGSIDPCVHQNHLIKVRLVNPAMSKWILYWLQSTGGRHFVELVASSTSGLYTLSVNKVGDLPVLLPPLAEQARIVAEVERRLSIIEELDAAVAANLQRSTRLRQSILQQAFSKR